MFSGPNICKGVCQQLRGRLRLSTAGLAKQRLGCKRCIASRRCKYGRADPGQPRLLHVTPASRCQRQRGSAALLPCRARRARVTSKAAHASGGACDLVPQLRQMPEAHRTAGPGIAGLHSRAQNGQRSASKVW